MHASSARNTHEFQSALTNFQRRERVSHVWAPPLHSVAFPLSRCINHIHNESTMFFWDNFEAQSVLDYRKKRDPWGKWHASSCGSLFLSIFLSIHPLPLSNWLFAEKWRENIKPRVESFLHAHLGRSLNITKQVQQRIRQHFPSRKHTELQHPGRACYVWGKKILKAWKMNWLTFFYTSF